MFGTHKFGENKFGEEDELVESPPLPPPAITAGFGLPRRGFWPLVPPLWPTKAQAKKVQRQVHVSVAVSALDAVASLRSVSVRGDSAAAVQPLLIEAWLGSVTVSGDAFALVKPLVAGASLGRVRVTAIRNPTDSELVAILLSV
jgi:hypothetical protein